MQERYVKFDVGMLLLEDKPGYSLSVVVDWCRVSGEAINFLYIFLNTVGIVMVSLQVKNAS